MSHTDPIADFLTRVRNAAQAGLPMANAPYTRIKEDMARAMLAEGFVAGVEVVGEGIRRELVVQLKYLGRKQPVITGLERVSKPGRRVYLGYAEIRPLRSGLGVILLSTPQGVVTDAAAKKLKVGGEVLCRVW